MNENAAIMKYFEFYKTQEMLENEKVKLAKIIVDEIEHERTFYQVKSRFNAENIRDFVLGMNDGLVEILGAVTGLSAIYVRNPWIVGISGLVVGVAGALSMAIGVFISVKSQREVNMSVKRRLEVLFTVSPNRAREELVERLTGEGISEKEAEEIALRIPESAIGKLLVHETKENEVKAAIYTGIAYLIGVFFPVIPYFIAKSSITALFFSVLLAGMALATVASIVSTISGLSLKRKVSEMVVFGLGAAFISYLFGTFMSSYVPP